MINHQVFRLETYIVSLAASFRAWASTLAHLCSSTPHLAERNLVTVQGYMRFCSSILVANLAKSAQFVLLFNRKKRIYTFIKGIYTRVTNEFELFADFSFGTFIRLVQK